MKRLTSLLLILIMAISVVSLTACKKSDTPAEKPASAAETVSATEAEIQVPEGAVPIATTAEGNATGYTKLDKDEDGHVTRDYTYDALGKLQGSVGYEYDENGFSVKEIRYGSDGSVAAQVLIERNEDGFETQRTEMDADGNVKMYVVTEYSEDGATFRTKYDADWNVIEDEE